MNPEELLKKLESNLESIAAQRDSLRQLCEEKDKKIAELNVKILGLEGQLSTNLEDQKEHSISTQRSIDNGRVKLKIDGLIEEIDECLALLNN